MSVSSVAPPAVAVVAPSFDSSKQVQKKKDAEQAYQPPPPAPLPPGQGTRVDQLA